MAAQGQVEDDDDEFGAFDGMLDDQLLAGAMDAFDRGDFGFGSLEADLAAVAELEAIERSLGSTSKATEGSARAAPPPRTAPCTHELDLEAARTWVYPTNRAVRDYQFEIIRVALFVNTLACIPTGLGKTFIATVVMYNYHRWFPRCKVVFACPTKPLVTQQMTAYRQTSGTPAQEIVELTGKQRPELRRQLWEEKRVFFLTPQTMHNDLLTGICPRDQIVCLVVDEAHRATGNAPYCEIVRKLDGCQVRILALTATPGGDADAVQAVVDNLRIGRIEMRTEEADEVRRYTHGRQLDIQVVPVGAKVGAVRNQLAACITPVLQRVQGGPGIEFYGSDPTRLAPFQALKSVNQYRGILGRNASQRVVGDLMLLHKLLYCMELLLQHGIRSFLAAILPWARENATGRVMQVRRELADNPTFASCLRDAQTAVESPSAPGHPKIERLVKLVCEHFEQHERALDESGAIGTERRETRVMIFSEFRESVSEIVSALEAHQPFVRATQFIGQGSGQPRNSAVRKGLAQKEQQEVLNLFKRGHYNTLVATCIGEEGLDIGDVDFIICFDAKSSPTRMLQRMGRTGRHREGRIVMLLTEGKEEQKYRRSQSSYRTVQRAIKDPQRIRMYPGNARILPEGIAPICELRDVEISKEPHEAEVARNTNPSYRTLAAYENLCYGNEALE
ncbi:P-loop containing nucleoside triphosphate hydrolase protein [Thamnocephalis sphaerospora]|uniref:ATP-dependent DNA helicase n=1 Tax=Thamnocephalis sphaerospora TaxID=78915 RepID=A0A4P9XNU7_9FUNG|nr:P-loop containing nucleoside triphosphate hydrolase protein [Thamnocephalis sphaerospora]|eukprot:RKP07512.1 P-loop containing nucleoside triphosphate hydrolase protein [Thamnocephalis sphaerospora]